VCVCVCVCVYVYVYSTSHTRRTQSQHRSFLVVGGGRACCVAGIYLDIGI